VTHKSPWTYAVYVPLNHAELDWLDYLAALHNLTCMCSCTVLVIRETQSKHSV